ncbi:guanine nucleotide-binding protein G(q) subunit alpha-like isoform X2 [Cottoperca gobio]|uniref:Guanine nucleotide-binding protein G(Q) subunit alpha-like isoform X2 n=1 Tax=Cottoperca gobio TaxID=56716 RepID=A0A6J2RKI5_COTGO|nr:guanine nucleotide-binding protein G(q) subunit alpha-like isoform X2 [Cottoperca gobio]
MTLSPLRDCCLSREAREAREALRISRGIDFQIRQERKELKFQVKANASLVRGVDAEKVTTLTKLHVDAIRSLWSDPGIQECYDLRRKYQLLDSAKYYLNDIDRICDAAYLPTEQDVLRVRLPTTASITDYPFKVGDLFYRMLDVGSSYSWRKWDKFQCFDECQSIMFVVPLSEYDQQENGMKQSVDLFRTIVTSRSLHYTLLVLLLNKTDLLEEKLMNSHLVDYFPEYDGPRRNVVAAKDFFVTMFSALSPHIIVYSHFICATDTNNTKFFFRELNDQILRRNMECVLCNSICSAGIH